MPATKVQSGFGFATISDMKIAELEHENRLLKDAVERLKPPEGIVRTFATVVSHHGDDLVIIRGGEVFVLPVKPDPRYNAGDTLLVAVEGGRVIGKVQDLATGPVVTVSGVDKDVPGWVQVSTPAGSLRVLVNESVEELEVGDKVILDSGGKIVTTRLPRPVKKEKPAEGIVRWEDIGGQEDAKSVLREIIEAPRMFPELYKAYKKRATKGVLLYGPPGCGKTMLGKAASVAMQGDTPVESGFIYVKATEILNQFVGASEANVRAIFAKAQQHKEKHGTSALIFIDEADAILGVRGDRAHLGMEQTIVPAFLTEMDGMEDSGAVVILATNRPDTLDPAVIRDGRIDRKVLVNRPGPKDVLKLTYLYLDKVPLAAKDDDEVGEMIVTVGKALYNDDGQPTDLGKIASGSLVAGIVDRAASIAFQRDARENATQPVGVTLDDLAAAITLAGNEFQAAQQNHLHL